MYTLPKNERNFPEDTCLLEMNIGHLILNWGLPGKPIPIVLNDMKTILPLCSCLLFGVTRISLFDEFRGVLTTVFLEDMVLRETLDFFFSGLLVGEEMTPDENTEKIKCHTCISCCILAMG